MNELTLAKDALTEKEEKEEDDDDEGDMGFSLFDGGYCLFDEPTEHFVKALEQFKKKKAVVLRKFTNSLKLASISREISRETILAVMELKKSIYEIADKFAEVSTSSEAEPVEPVEPVASTSSLIVKKKVYKLKPKEGVTEAEIDEAFLAEFEELDIEEPKEEEMMYWQNLESKKKKKSSPFCKKPDGASTSNM
jgi:hypothetical protein